MWITIQKVEWGNDGEKRNAMLQPKNDLHIAILGPTMKGAMLVCDWS
jgi:hypothetical protein